MCKSNQLGRLEDHIEPLWTVILVPIWQEALFRYVPFQLWFVPTKDFWTVGLVSSAIFASIHFYFGWKFVLYAFVGGLVLWWAMVHYGFTAAVHLHAVANAIDLTFGLRYKLGRQRPT